MSLQFTKLAIVFAYSFYLHLRQFLSSFGLTERPAETPERKGTDTGETWHCPTQCSEGVLYSKPLTLNINTSNFNT